MTPPEPDDDIARILDTARGGRSRRWRRWLAAIGLVLAAVAAVLVWRAAGQNGTVRYLTQPATRGDLTVTVTATGNLEPTNQVDVGSELSGIVKTVAVDYNDRVKVGDILATLDTDKLRARVLQSQAALASAEARVQQAQASVLETRLKAERCQKLTQRQLCTGEDVDATRAAYARAQAEEAIARAQVAEAQATLEADRTDLAKAVIRSPIDGIVLERNVDPGQTVAASFQAPVLFTLAEDLTRMELHVHVDEADVGLVREGQAATFTVDAYPERSFPARITQVRYAAQTVDGVVSYETVLDVDNAELLLRPGLTATADITVQQIEAAMLVPNAALRFTPPAAASPASGGGLLSALLPRPPARVRRQETDDDGRRQRVWTLRDGQPVAISVDIGASDGIRTEITSGDVEPGLPLVIDTVSASP